MHENEPKHWFDDARMSPGILDREKKLYFQACARADPPLQGPLAPLSVGRRCSPASPPFPRHGHTPGHTTFIPTSSGNEQLLATRATRCTCRRCRTARPEVCMEFDTDKDAAAALRRLGVRHGRDRPPAGDGHAPAFPGLRAPRAPRHRLSADPRSPGSRRCNTSGRACFAYCVSGGVVGMNSATGKSAPARRPFGLGLYSGRGPASGSTSLR